MENEYSSVKILHCGDIHLGSDFKSLGTKSRTRKADLDKTFLKMISLCETEGVDILLIAGDLFDSWHISEATLDFARDAFGKIPDTKIIIAPGNHDPAAYGTPYLREDYWPDNVYIFTGEFDSILIEALSTEIWGAGFTSVYAEQSLLGEVNPKRPDFIQLGIIHGAVGAKSKDELYNPITPAQIRNTKLDYLAIGHVHEFSEILSEGKTRYAYSGCFDGRGFDETGEKGVIIGTVSSDGVRDLNFRSLSSRLYQTAKIDITDCINASNIAERIRKQLKNDPFCEKYPYEENLYKIYLVGKINFPLNLEIVKTYLDELFFVKLRDKTTIEINIDEVSAESSLRGVFVRKYLDSVSETIKDSEKAKLENALNIGLKAFAGEVAFYED